MIVTKDTTTEFKDINLWHELLSDFSWTIANAIDYIEENDIGFRDKKDFLKDLVGVIEDVASDYNIELYDL